MRTGVAGNGTIVRRFLKDAAQVEDVRTTAICVRERSREKGEELAREYGMKVYTDYEAFLREGDMDTVYVGLINTQHYSYAKQALLAGKHVICEKPLTETAAQARELADLAREKNLFLWEAFKLPYGSILPAVKEHVKELGPVRVVQCNSASRAVLCLGGEETEIACQPEKGSLKPEIQAFARQLQTGDRTPCYEMLKHSVQVMEILDDLNNSL